MEYAENPCSETENKSDGQICAGCGRYCSLEITWCPNCAEDLRSTKKEMEAKVVHKMEDINSIEKANLLWAFGLLSQVELWLDLDKVSVVDFHGSRILGTFLASTESVRLNRSVLSDRAELFSTFLHEIAHKYGYGSDGTDDHRCNIERIAAQVVVNLTKTNAATEEVEKDYTLDELLS